MQGNNFQIKLGLIAQKIRQSWVSFNQWLTNTPERSLRSAYQSAQAIKDIELAQFGGRKIAPESVNHGEAVMSYWQNVLRLNLFNIKVRLAEFNLSSNLHKVTSCELLEQLKLIDEVVTKYDLPDEFLVNSGGQLTTQLKQNNDSFLYKQFGSPESITNLNKQQTQETISAPKSINKNIHKNPQNFSRKSEEEFVRNYRISSKRTKKAVRFLIILVIVPLLVQNLSQRLILNPVVEKIRGDGPEHIFINSDLKKDAFKELNIFRESLRFESFVRLGREMAPEEIASEVKSKAVELAEEFRKKSNHALSNIFADLTSLLAFAAIIFLGKKDIFFVKSLIDQVAYGFSDSAKAFIIILSGDIFVGFHSPHGWEVLLDGLAEHLGLPANESVIFVFIATFPVILATIFKYWIFRYLSRLSPSALATLREMDD
jgi:hypothetical protein